MSESEPQNVELNKSTVRGKSKAAFDRDEKAARESDRNRQIGQRLETLRLAFGGETQKVWCEKNGIRQTAWNNWELGNRRISVEEAEKLCQRYGLTLDWIYLGRRDGLSASAAKVL